MQLYQYETPIWAVRSLCVFAITVSIACLFGFIYWFEWAGATPLAIRWLFFAIAMVFLLAGLKPRNWKAWRYFYADSSGVHFPSECPETEATHWLSVPWNEVGKIQKERFVNRYVGPTLELSISEQEIDSYFCDVKLKKQFFNRIPVENGYFKVGYSNAFKNPDNAVKVLNAFKNNAPNKPH